MNYHENTLSRCEWMDDDWNGYTVVYAPRRYNRCPECGSPVIKHMRTPEGDHVKCGNPDCGMVRHLRGGMMDSPDADIMHAWMCAVDNWISTHNTEITSDGALEECPCCGGRLMWEIREGHGHEVSACVNCGWTDKATYVDRPIAGKEM